jgi:hypothetical protein
MPEIMKRERGKEKNSFENVKHKKTGGEKKIGQLNLLPFHSPLASFAPYFNKDN